MKSVRAVSREGLAGERSRRGRDGVDSVDGLEGSDEGALDWVMLKMARTTGRRLRNCIVTAHRPLRASPTMCFPSAAPPRWATAAASSSSSTSWSSVGTPSVGAIRRNSSSSTAAYLTLSRSFV